VPGLDEDKGTWGAEPITIGPYRVIRRLGAGGMGEVYLARSPGGRPVAVKTVGSGGPLSDADRRRFTREVSLARRIGAAYTAVVIDAAPEAELPWMATQYIPAPSLAELVRSRGPLPVDAARWVAGGAAEALAALHGEGIVHRDLKPSNILLPADGARLIDFGISHPAELTRTTVTLGTVAFASPEQARGERSTPASDVYALGATLFYLVAGRPPYTTGDPVQLLARVSRADHDLAGLPSGLEDVVLSCLRRDPQDRPAAVALVETLRAGLDTRPQSIGAGDWLPDSWLGLIREHETRAADRTAQAGSAPAREPDTLASQVAQAAARTRLYETRQTAPALSPAPSPERPLEGGRALRAFLAALAVIFLAAVALVVPGLLRGEADDDAGKATNDVTYSDTTPATQPSVATSSNPGPGHSEAVAFMDSVTTGDCLNLHYTDTDYAPGGLPRKVSCGSSAAATRVTRVISVDSAAPDPPACPGGADGSRWSPDEFFDDAGLRALCVNRIFRVGDCFPARAWTGGQHDEGLGVSIGRKRTAHTFSK
jgi:hypothetical protein